MLRLLADGQVALDRSLVAANPVPLGFQHQDRHCGVVLEPALDQGGFEGVQPLFDRIPNGLLVGQVDFRK